MGTMRTETEKPLQQGRIRLHRGVFDLPEYKFPENRNFHTISEEVRGRYGNSQTRFEEIIEFAKRAAYGRLGIDFCIGPAEETQFVAGVLSNHFKVESVCCKMGGLNKDEHGMSKIDQEKFEIACNPIGQAKMLNRAKTDLNVQLGLRPGHDILFQKYSEAPATVLAVKARVLANNPMGGAYGSYRKCKLGS